MQIKEKLDASNLLNTNENQPLDDKPLSNQSSQQIQTVSSISTNANLNEFDNQKLQEQLNLQIQSNQQHLEQFNQQSNLNKPNFQQSHLLQQKLSAEQLNELNQKLQQQENQLNKPYQNPPSDQQFNQSDAQLSPQQNLQPNTQLNQSQLKQVQLNQQEQPNTSTEVAKLASPIANFDPSSFLGWFSKNDIINKVTENAVHGFNQVLITLDPQMKEIRRKLFNSSFFKTFKNFRILFPAVAGGPNILITSNHLFDLDSIRDGFLDVFKRATVKSIETISSVETAAQLG